MASQLVGFENIPNVYITKINLVDNNTQTYQTNVFLEIDDKAENGRFIWSSEEIFLNYLKVGLIITSNSDLVQQITVGLQSPLPSEVAQSPFYDEKTTIQTLPVREFMNSTEESYKTYRKKASFLSPFGQKNLTIFAVCYLDTVGLENLFEINLGGSLKQYFGALTSEKILENGIFKYHPHRCYFYCKATS
jgi:hypothetical protein